MGELSSSAKLLTTTHVFSRVEDCICNADAFVCIRVFVNLMSDHDKYIASIKLP